jgi:Amt family ammonium transporter
MNSRGTLQLQQLPSDRHTPSSRVWLDVSEKKELATLRKTQEALIENERQYRLLAENAKDVIWTADLNLNWNYFSPSVASFRGFTAEETLGQDLNEILTPTSVESATRTFFLELEQAKLHHDATTRVRTLELEFICRDGSTVWGDVKVSFLCNEAGDPIGLVGVVRDITDRRKQEAELKKYATALKSANESLEQLFAAAQAARTAKNEFFANMSHEIRTPMTAILGYADILADKLVDSDHLEAIDIIRRNGQYLLKIIDDILDISKAEAGKLQVEEVNFSPVDLLSDVVSLLRGRAGAKNLPLDVQYEDRIPQMIRNDPTRLRQVLINLVANAIKFTESGHVRIVVGLMDEEGQPPRLRFDVVDTGIGIEPERIGTLFQPFTQVDDSSHRRFGGTGLGLTISRRLAKMMGGDISVQSAKGQGSTFRLTVATGPLDGIQHLPGNECLRTGALARPKDTGGQEGPSDRCDSNRQTDAPKLAPHCRVLLAEDGPDNQRLISFLLAKAGAEVVLATDGKIAVEKALAAMPGQGTVAEPQAPEFNLILMDMQMPVMDGYEATRLLREKGYTRPIIALTAHAMKHDRQNCLDAGCDDYLSKPIDRNTLLATVARFAKFTVSIDPIRPRLDASFGRSARPIPPEGTCSDPDRHARIRHDDGSPQTLQQWLGDEVSTSEDLEVRSEEDLSNLAEALQSRLRDRNV